MINPDELLKSSLVDFGEHNRLQIYGLGENQGEENCYVYLDEFSITTSDDVDPIEIYSELLLDLGFTQIIKYPNTWNFELDDLLLAFDFNTSKIKSIRIKNSTYYVSINYIHCLQHFYFVVTKKHLTFDTFKEYIPY